MFEYQNHLPVIQGVSHVPIHIRKCVQCVHVHVSMGVCICTLMHGSSKVTPGGLYCIDPGGYGPTRSTRADKCIPEGAARESTFGCLSASTLAGLTWARAPRLHPPSGIHLTALVVQIQYTPESHGTSNTCTHPYYGSVYMYMYPSIYGSVYMYPSIYGSVYMYPYPPSRQSQIVHTLPPSFLLVQPPLS